jgi:hypothetical protein
VNKAPVETLCNLLFIYKTRYRDRLFWFRKWSIPAVIAGCDVEYTKTNIIEHITDTTTNITIKTYTVLLFVLYYIVTSI